MPKSILKPAVIAACLLAFVAAAHADEAMERMLDEAMPHMHHSCESVLGTYPDDDEAVAGIVRLMVAVSLYNREIDVLACPSSGFFGLLGPSCNGGSGSVSV